MHFKTVKSFYPRLELATDENDEAVKKIVIITIKEVGENVAISVGSCHTICSEVLDKKPVAAKFVLQLLNFRQQFSTTQPSLMTS